MLIPSTPVILMSCPTNGQLILIDENDILKTDGKQFEAPGLIWNNSESTQTKNVYKKGYHVTETVPLTFNKHPVTIFPRIHSSAEKDYKSVNTITFNTIKQAAALFDKSTFVMDRVHDDNRIFLMLDQPKQDYVIRLKSNRKLLYLK